MEKADEKYKVVIVGQSNTGKSSLLTRFTSQKFVNEHFPTLLPTCNSHVFRDKNGSYELAIWDTAGSDSWISMNTSVYHGAQTLVFLCSFDEPDSLSEIQSKWLPLINEHVDSDTYLPFFAINKVDLKDKCNLNENLIQDIADLLNVETVYYVSAQNGIGVNELFEAIRLKTREKYGRPQIVDISDTKRHQCKC